MSTSKIQLSKYELDSAEYIRIRDILTTVLTVLVPPPDIISTGDHIVYQHWNSIIKIKQQVSLIDKLPTINSWSDIKRRNIESCIDNLLDLHSTQSCLSCHMIELLHNY